MAEAAACTRGSMQPLWERVHCSAGSASVAAAVACASGGVQQPASTQHTAPCLAEATAHITGGFGQAPATRKRCPGRLAQAKAGRGFSSEGRSEALMARAKHCCIRRARVSVLSPTGAQYSECRVSISVQRSAQQEACVLGLGDRADGAK